MPSAHRDLDAICALFDEAARVEGRRGHTAVGTFVDTLAAQTIPAGTLADKGVQADGVRLMTAHRSKGLEWRLVVVAHVQDGLWPDLRQRSTLLRAGELGRDEVLPPVDAHTMLAEERRLFYVACTRAKERLLVTAVASVDDNGEQPSRFLRDLVERPAAPAGPSAPSAQPRGARSRSCDVPSTTPVSQTTSAMRPHSGSPASRRSTHRGRRLVPAAHPDRWWGVAETSRAEAPILADDACPA